MVISEPCVVSKIDMDAFNNSKDFNVNWFCSLFDDIFY